MTVTYRSVLSALLVVALIAAVGYYFLFPESGFTLAVNRIGNRALDKVGLGNARGDRAGEGPQQAHFTNIDGTVRVKRASSNTWVTADYNLPLDKGDVVQTSSEGMAKIVFADGTSYTIKQDSLIVVEENSTTEKQQTQVAVQVTTGTVDLATGSYNEGSKSQVIVAGATASLAPQSAAMVHNDPRRDQHEILLKHGSGRVTRNNETVTLSDYERVTFKAQSAQMVKEKEIGPPTLIAPANMMPVYTAGTGKPVEFSWTPVVNSRSYRVRVSRNPYFSSTVFDHVVQETEAKVPGLKEGTYYWVVTAQDTSGRESVESERNQFTLVARAPDNLASLPLDIEPFVQHGHVIEIKGKTDPTARVMVNGNEVPIIRSDGTFNYFTPPLPRGESVLTITAQNPRGGVKTQQKRVVLE